MGSPLAGDITQTAAGDSEPGAGTLPSVGTVVSARYRLVRVIGEGGMGTVFEAEILSVGRRCAIKFLRRELAGRLRSVPRFEREARLLARLEHEHITAVLDYGWLGESTPFIVMEYLQGHTLRDRLRREGALASAVALELLAQACCGMAHAHAEGVVHRDLKPDNLFLSQRSDGRPWVKILDFGVASASSELAAHLTPTGAELGTAHYMAPEQARGARDIDCRADVYALGAILYEVLAGRRVFDGGSYNEVLFQVITEPHVPLERLLPACPAPLVAVVDRCLRKDASERFQDARELLAALEAVRSDLGSAARLTALDVVSNPVAAAGKRSRRAGAILLSAGALLGLGFVAGLRWSSPEPRQPHAERVLLAPGVNPPADEAPAGEAPAGEAPGNADGERSAASGRASPRPGRRADARRAEASIALAAAASSPAPVAARAPALPRAPAGVASSSPPRRSSPREVTPPPYLPHSPRVMEAAHGSQAAARAMPLVTSNPYAEP